MCNEKEGVEFRLTKKKTEFQMHESRMAKLEHKLKVAEEAKERIVQGKQYVTRRKELSLD